MNLPLSGLLGLESFVIIASSSWFVIKSIFCSTSGLHNQFIPSLHGGGCPPTGILRESPDDATILEAREAHSGEVGFSSSLENQSQKNWSVTGVAAPQYYHEKA